MKNFILMISFIVFSAVSLFWCKPNLEKSLDANNTTLAQTNVFNTNLSQNKKLNPYELYNEPSEITLEGNQAKPIATAIEAFKAEKRIPTEKKNLDNYKLELRQDAKVFMVSIIVKRDPKKDYVGGETENGIDVTYVISKENGQVITSVFYK